MKLIYLEWQDAHTSHGWHKDEEIREFIEDQEFYIRECGWLVSETKKDIVIATAWRKPTPYWAEQFLNLHKIPKTWVRKRKIITCEAFQKASVKKRAIKIKRKTRR